MNLDVYNEKNQSFDGYEAGNSKQVQKPATVNVLALATIFWNMIIWNETRTGRCSRQPPQIMLLSLPPKKYNRWPADRCSKNQIFDNSQILHQKWKRRPHRRRHCTSVESHYSNCFMCSACRKSYVFMKWLRVWNVFIHSFFVTIDQYLTCLFNINFRLRTEVWSPRGQTMNLLKSTQLSAMHT